MKKPVVGYEGLYEVSDDGRVFSVKRNKEIAQRYDKYGYKRCNLSKEGKMTVWLVHRLVADAFIPNPEGKSTVNHKDENKENNCADNLEWMTFAENTQYGTRGQRAAAALCKPIRCVETGVVYESLKAAAEAMGTTPQNLGASMRRKGTCRNCHWEYIKED